MLFKRGGLLAISFMLLFCVSGCNNSSEEKTKVTKAIDDVQVVQKNDREITDICLDLYRKAEEEKKISDLETIHGIVKRFGEKGYPAVDSKNQMDMVQAEQVIRFCEMVEKKEEAEITILEIDDLGGLIKYDLHTKDGSVNVVRNYYQYKNGKIRKKDVGNYEADDWKYTKEGYLMFSGVWFSKEQYILTLSETEEHKAFRVQPLAERYRELNRKYLMPVGYEQNNMFLVDWDEHEFGDLNFYDMYDIFYPNINAKSVPCDVDDDLGGGTVYNISRDEFEHVIMTYFKIDSETLQSKTVYDSKNSAYEYRPRGFYEAEYPEYPYSEVVGDRENGDGTIALTVQVVFPYAGDSKVYTHEVVVRPFEDGRVQYVSNRVISSKDNHKGTWYKPRLTKEGWREIYEKSY
ncbi:MAG: hypothetical protein HFI37_00315 [Lachnospiraceae bacterium]|nr:hypothetical protein [Lachnospiraceae bacterium]